MSKFSDYTENNIIETTLRGAAFPVPLGVYVALFTSDPTDAGSGTEATWPSYARQDAADGGPVSDGWGAASDGSTSNALAITFPPNDGVSQITITHIGIYDDSVGGNLLYHAGLTSTKTLAVSDVISFATGAITVNVA